jgi:hypothetical protein
VDQNNLYYCKSRLSPDKSKQYYNFVHCDATNCKATLWTEVGKLMVKSNIKNQHNHGTPIFGDVSKVCIFLVP